MGTTKKLALQKTLRQGLKQKQAKWENEIEELLLAHIKHP